MFHGQVSSNANSHREAIEFVCVFVLDGRSVGLEPRVESCHGGGQLGGLALVAARLHQGKDRVEESHRGGD